MIATLAPELEFEFSLKPSDDPELTLLLLDFTGRAIAWDDEAGEDVSVGVIKGHRLDLAAARAMHVDFQHFLGSVSPQVADLGARVFNGEGSCRLIDDRRHNSGHAECDCLVYIEELIVTPEYRGRHIGTRLMQRMSQSLDMENGLVALKAAPITGRSELAGRPIADVDREKVKRFYERLGFVRSSGDFMIKDARNCASQKIRRQAAAV